MPADIWSRLPAWAPLPLRFGLGLVMLAHGSQKLLGWFGGRGFAGAVETAGGLGFQPAVLWGVLLVAAEFGGGLLLLFGFLTRFAAASIFIDMLIAMFMVHWKNGFFMRDGGIEFTMCLALMALALFLAGAGPLSVDRKIGWKMG